MTNDNRWDIFCRVVDHYGDIGICWRLARQLAHEYEVTIRLWVDDLASFSRLCREVDVHASRQQLGAIEVCHWTDDFPDVEPAEVIIEAFACDLPENYVRAMSVRPTAPVWINLEYLTAENWVEGCQGLPSPHPRYPLTKYFFFPGFTAKTGGLIRERDLLARRAAFDEPAANNFWRSLSMLRQPEEGEIRVSLFCYQNPQLPKLLDYWQSGNTRVRLFVTPGPALEQVSDWLGPYGRTFFVGVFPLRQNSLSLHPLRFLSQERYDQLLWACDVNFVRGEDSFVRAQWAQKPFLWQIYPQQEGAHLPKLEAFLDHYLEKYPDPEAIRRCFQTWNGEGDIIACWREFLRQREQIQEQASAWASQLDQQGNLADNLCRFVQQKRGV